MKKTFFPRNKPPPGSIGLVSCGKSKRRIACQAKFLYTGNLFKAQYAAACRENEQVFILSAKYGLVKPEAALKPYDLKLSELSDIEKQQWAKRVIAALPSYKILKVYAGSDYWNLLKHLPQAFQPYTGRIGERLKQIKEGKPHEPH